MRNEIPPGPLHTEGARIVGSDGRPVRICGVNWYGMECDGMVPGGLDRRTVDDICRLVVELGFNHIRLPYCDRVVVDATPVTAGVDANPELRGQTRLQVMDAVIATAGRHRLRVVLDSHRSDPGWSAQENGLWYTRHHPPRLWRRGLRALARRHRDGDTVIGIDLRNEPGSPPIDARHFPANGGAVWGEPDRLLSLRPRDWAAAAESAGNAVLEVNPSLLVLVEGVRTDPAGPVFGGELQSYWPGGNLCGVRAAGGRRQAPRPIALQVPSRLVYSVHDYGPDMHAAMPWCQAGSTAETADACRSVWDQAWGFIARDGIAPVYVGEFGTPNDAVPVAPAGDRASDDAAAAGWAQQRWLSHLVGYMNELDVSWAYWCLNGDQPRSVGRQAGAPERYGVLDPAWTAPASASLLATLDTLQGPFGVAAVAPA